MRKNPTKSQMKKQTPTIPAVLSSDPNVRKSLTQHTNISYLAVSEHASIEKENLMTHFKAATYSG